jgi:hypothetical protein
LGAEFGPLSTAKHFHVPHSSQHAELIHAEVTRYARPIKR